LETPGSLVRSRYRMASAIREYLVRVLHPLRSSITALLARQT
jgi:hypothetical protein